ncbi:MAG: hypothetical protein GF329_18625 [Candidatus Lokiarchaeota archaeon]|nr:hypothetical protein [Candidatus Lokiarchaeota archaeon]
MKDINGIYIITEEGKILFNHELYIQGSDMIDSSLFSNFVLSIQQFSKTIGEKQANRIELGKSKVFISKDKEKKIIFVVRSSKSANNKKMLNNLKQIQKKFIKKFDSKVIERYDPDKIKMYIYNLFITEVEKIIKGDLDKNFSEFFDTI